MGDIYNYNIYNPTAIMGYNSTKKLVTGPTLCV